MSAPIDNTARPSGLVDRVTELVQALPDEPRWVEAHGIAADPASWRAALGDGAALGSDAARLIVVIGDASSDAIAALALARPAHAMLFAHEAQAIASGRPYTRASIHTAAHDEDGGEGAVALPADASLAHLPPALAEELARATGTVWAAFVDGEAVSFAYATWRSARFFDVSVDTLPGARQLGLGRIVAAALIHDERAKGRAPVWGADEDNAASLRLAASLGFVEVDALWVAPGVA